MSLKKQKPVVLVTLLAGVWDMLSIKVLTDYLFIHPNQTKVCKKLLMPAIALAQALGLANTGTGV